MNRRTTAALAALIIGGTAAILLAMGRPPICTCGDVDFWASSGLRQSQMLADWYSPSHIVHGFLFFGLFAVVAGKRPVDQRFIAALLVETAWEIAENTPMVIDRYREATMALGYSGDSILNSMSDVAMMAAGFLAAWRLPAWVSVLAVIALEIVPLVVIRDNLTLNIWMLLTPNEAILHWQSNG